MLERPHHPRIEGSRLRAGSYFWSLMSATGIEMRFGEPISPDTVWVDVFAIGGELVEQTIVSSGGGVVPSASAITAPSRFNIAGVEQPRLAVECPLLGDKPEEICSG
jgi:hypothetical protein